MKNVAPIRGVFVVLAVCGCCLPQSVWAATAAGRRPPTAIDVALAEGGTLIGQVVNPEGAALPDVPVSLWSKDQKVATAKTDATGGFAVRGLRGGVYQVVAGSGRREFRFWKPGTAPPLARQGVLVVAGGDTVRGNLPGMGALRFWLSDPWIVAGVVATAVAVPVAIYNAKEPASP